MVLLMGSAKKAVLGAVEQPASGLLHSLEEPSADEVEAAWIEEAERRYADLKAGRVEGVPANEAFARIRANLQAEAVAVRS